VAASISVARNQHYLIKGYYHGDLEKEGVWIGEGAQDLGLSGKVEEADMAQLWHGYSPEGDKLVQNAGSEQRKAAWDITFSAPKSYSAMWAVADDKLKADLEVAHQRAVLDSLQYLEDNAAYTRRGAGGSRQEQVGLVFATFQHGLSRSQDPQLHTHALVLNIGTRADSSTGAIESQHLYDRKIAAGSVYRMRLATESERLGFKVERREKGFFEVKGVSKELTHSWSTRSNQVTEHLKSNGLENTPQNRERATLITRTAKGYVDEGKARHHWQNQAEKFGVTAQSVRVLQSKRQEYSKAQKLKNKQLVLATAIEKSTRHKSVFTERVFDREIADAALGKGLTYEDLKATKLDFFKSANAVELEGDKRDRFFTTAEQLALEKKLKACVASRDRDLSHTVQKKSVSKAVRAYPDMSNEQKYALSHITNPGGVKVVSGIAGSGKGYMLGAAKDAWKRDGYTVQGVALSGKAASGLQDAAKIQSRTVDSLFYSLDRQRALQAHEPLKTGQFNHSPIGKETVIVADEAAMIGTRKMTRLFEEADVAGSKVVLVGDSRQLQPIESGGAFKSISEQVGQAELNSIKRQKEKWARDAVHDFANGRASQGLDAYHARGLLTVTSDRQELREKLIKDWAAAGGVSNPKEHLILANTNREVDMLNKLAQEKRHDAGELAKRHTSINEKRFFERDRILFGQNDNRLKVKNGMCGTLTRIDLLRKNLTVTLDNQKTVTFPKKDYDKISLAYAVTTHKSQGLTVQNSYLLVGGKMQDREISYVQASRARERTKFYTQADSTQQALLGLSQQMKKSNQKTLASERQPLKKHSHIAEVGQQRR